MTLNYAQLIDGISLSVDPAAPANSVNLDSSGRLLVGTSSALTNVYINNTAVTPTLQIEGSSGPTTSLSITRQTGAAANLVLQRGISGTPVVDGNGLGQINFNGFDGTNFRNAAQIFAEIDGTPGAGDMPGRLIFKTTSAGSATSTERMRIDKEGRVGINTTDPTGGGALAGTGSKVVTIEGNFATGSRCLALATDTGGGDLPLQVVDRTNYATQKFVIYGDGSVENTNGSIGTLSDIRFKTNIAPASSQWQDIKDIEIVNYDMQGEDRRLLGVVAQQVETVSPGLVVDRPKYNEQGEETDSIKGVRLSILYMKAVKALQEAMERIETLEAKVTA